MLLDTLGKKWNSGNFQKSSICEHGSCIYFQDRRPTISLGDETVEEGWLVGGVVERGSRVRAVMGVVTSGKGDGALSRSTSSSSAWFDWNIHSQHNLTEARSLQ